MKVIYVIGSILSFFTILILSFENIQASCNYLTFFIWELSASIAPTFVLLGTAFFGVVTGVFMTLAGISLFGNSDEDEDDVDFSA